MVGKKIHRLTVLNLCDYRLGGQAVWHCKCDCGNEIDVRGACLRNGHTKSCGCLQKETGGRKPTHNGYKTRLYSIWVGMIKRCYTPSSGNYRLYGKRGISVCDEWRNSFISFRDWALANGYKDCLTIDRIDGNKNYEPSNCRWATQKEQSNNISTNHYLEANGKRMTVCQWAEYLGVNHKTLETRIHRGWSDERVVNTPIRKYGDRK